MSTLSVTTITTANATTDLTLRSGNSSGAGIIVPANGQSIIFQSNSSTNDARFDSVGNLLLNSATLSPTQTAGGSVAMTGTLAMGSSFLRNRIINGAMQIWQRGTSGSLSSYGYVADRWCGGQFNTQTMARSTSVPSTAGNLFQYSLQAQRPNGATNTGLISAIQVIESVNCYDLAGQSVTLSFWAKAGANFSAASSLLGVQIHTGTVADQGGNYPYYSWTGNATPINTTQAITATWTKYSFTGTIGSGVLEMAAVFYHTPTGTAGADDSFYITGVQLEVGSVATPFERRQYGQELALCQRYLPVSESGTATGAGPIAVLQWVSSTAFQAQYYFQVNPRVPPTGITVSSASHFLANYAGSANPTVTGLTFSEGTFSGCSMTGTVASGGGTAGLSGYLRSNSTASAKIQFTGCEL